MSRPWAIACCWLLCRKLWKHKDPAPTWAVPTSPLELEHLHFSQFWADHHFLLPGSFLKFQAFSSVPSPICHPLSKCFRLCAQGPLGAPTPSCHTPLLLFLPLKPSPCAFSATLGSHFSIVVQSQRLTPEFGHSSLSIGSTHTKQSQNAPSKQPLRLERAPAAP